MTALRMLLPLAGLAALASVARADHLTMHVQQMVSSFETGCQMGDPNACGAIQYVQGLEAQMEQAYGACQTGDQNACAFAQAAEGQLLGDFGRWQQANFGGGGGAAPSYDPNNPLGPTHADRMDAIAGMGAQSTQTFNDTMSGMDAQQGQFLDYLNQ